MVLRQLALNYAEEHIQNNFTKAEGPACNGGLKINPGVDLCRP